MSELRLFIAVDVPLELKQSLSSFCRSLYPLGEKCRWVSQANMHFTLRFLGNTQEEKVAQLRKALQRCAAKSSSFKLRIQHFGVFPAAGLPKVFWAGPDNKAAACLNSLFSTLENELLHYGFKPQERPFVPHLTLCRIKGGRIQRVTRQKNALLNWSSDWVKVENISLYKSSSGVNGPVYEKLDGAVLGYSI